MSAGDIRDKVKIISLAPEANKPSYRFETCKQMCDSAADQGLWLFDPVDKRWYTPMEYLKHYEFCRLPYDQFKRVQLASPWKGILVGRQRIKILQEKLDALMQKVFDAYDLK